MYNIPDIVGLRLEEGLEMLSDFNCEIEINETFGKKQIITENVRIIRQNNCENNIIKLIIAYF